MLYFALVDIEDVFASVFFFRLPDFWCVLVITERQVNVFAVCVCVCAFFVRGREGGSTFPFHYLFGYRFVGVCMYVCVDR